MTEDHKPCTSPQSGPEDVGGNAREEVCDVRTAVGTVEDVREADTVGIAETTGIAGSDETIRVSAEHSSAMCSMCSMCKENPPKYTCPGCGRKTCSLDCVNRHKEAFSCTGKRDRTAFVSRGDLSYDTLVSDYKFLEEVQRIEDISQRSQPPVPRRQLPKPLKVLIQQARNRDVTLQLMSPGMKRRKENSTRYDFKTKVLFWRVLWVFSDGKEAVTSRMSEHTTIRDAIDKVFSSMDHAEKGTGDCRGASMNTGSPGTSPGASPASPEYKVWMHQEGVRADQAVDFDVDVSLTLGEFLRGKHIVEYPVFRVQRAES